MDTVRQQSMRKQRRSKERRNWSRCRKSVEDQVCIKKVIARRLSTVVSDVRSETPDFVTGASLRFSPDHPFGFSLIGTLTNWQQDKRMAARPLRVALPASSLKSGFLWQLGHHAERRGQFLKLQPGSQQGHGVVRAGLAGNLFDRDFRFGERVSGLHFRRRADHRPAHSWRSSVGGTPPCPGVP